MKMRRRVIVEEHPDDNAEKPSSVPGSTFLLRR